MSVLEFETIQWTRRTRDLWTGRRSGAPVGTIERGARFTYVDLDGEPHRGYRSLADAQEAAAGPVTRSTCGPDAGRRRVHPVLFAAATGAVVTDLLLLAGAWMLTV
jgi:hypothetical protein